MVNSMSKLNFYSVRFYNEQTDRIEKFFIKSSEKNKEVTASDECLKRFAQSLPKAHIIVRLNHGLH